MTPASTHTRITSRYQRDSALPSATLSQRAILAVPISRCQLPTSRLLASSTRTAPASSLTLKVTAKPIWPRLREQRARRTISPTGSRHTTMPIIAPAGFSSSTNAHPYPPARAPSPGKFFRKIAKVVSYCGWVWLTVFKGYDIIVLL